MIGFTALPLLIALIFEPSAIVREPLNLLAATAGAVLPAFGLAFFVTGCITSYQNWRDERRLRNNASPPIGQDDGRALGQASGFVGRLDADGSASSAASRRDLPPHRR